MKSILSKIIIFQIFVFLTFPFFVNAQTLEVRSSPTYPSVGDTVSVSVSAFGLSVDTSEISWYKDGKFERKGVGMKNYNFPISENGNTIRVSVKTQNGTLEQTVKVNPSSMDVLWEVVGGYEPPFYKGKIVPIKSSRIKVVAIPQIKNEKGLVPASSGFIYTWKKDGLAFAGQSGYGANSFSYSPGVLDRQNTIEVTASGLSRSLAKNLTITPASAEIHFYEYNPAYGPMYNKTIKTGQTFDRRRINIVAEPYFIFTKNLFDPSLKTVWQVNGKDFPTDLKNMILLNIAENVNSVDLTFKTDHTTQLLQSNSRPLRLNIKTNE
jgi:hypothetical protein